MTTISKVARTLLFGVTFSTLAVATPTWHLTLPNARVNIPYTASVAGEATSSNNSAMTFAISNGPNWLTISSAGVLSGTPGLINLGPTVVTLTVTDSNGTAAIEADLNVRKHFHHMKMEENSDDNN